MILQDLLKQRYEIPEGMTLEMECITLPGGIKTPVPQIVKTCSDERPDGRYKLNGKSYANVANFIKFVLCEGECVDGDGLTLDPMEWASYVTRKFEATLFCEIDGFMIFDESDNVVNEYYIR